MVLTGGFLVTMTGCDQDVGQIAKTIKLSTASATSIGLVAIPNPEEADKVAEEAVRVLEDIVLPIFEGEESGFVEALGELRQLKAFDKEETKKIRLILLKVLPLLEANLPDDLADQALERVPDDVRAYLEAFFTGVLNGAKAYLGDVDGLRGSPEYESLRQQLAE
jgi:hypothetical protein